MEQFNRKKKFLVIYSHSNCKFFTLRKSTKWLINVQDISNAILHPFLFIFCLTPNDLFNDWQSTSFWHMSGIQISIFHGCVIHDLNMWFHIVILYCATSIAMNMKGNRSASRDIKHWIMHNSYFRRPPKTFSFEVFECIKINFLSQLATHQDIESSIKWKGR